MAKLTDFDFGDMAQDVITGLKGIVTGKVEYQNGCHKVSIQPEAKGNTHPDSVWIDVQAVRILKKKVKVLKLDKGVVGGPNFKGVL